MMDFECSMGTLWVLSPHPDDAVLSCGGPSTGRPGPAYRFG
jgi:LmbE family N-acetylglucosaminyl deacetylase